jgi:Protein of unknown function (DUF3618)
MTTTGRASEPAKRPAAEAEELPGAGLPPEATAGAGLPPEAAGGDDRPEAGQQAGAEPSAPDDVQQLQQEIERTREQLGETVEQLAAKADVKARAREKAAELSGRAKSTTSQARKEAAARAGRARNQLADKTAAARHKAMAVSRSGPDQMQRRIAARGKPVWEATPEQVRRAVAKGASSAKQRRGPIAAAVSVLILGYVVIRRWRRR